MAHCPYERLLDLEAILEKIRTWDRIQERRPGIFYLKGTPFLHFHLKDGKRWADVRRGLKWGPELEIPIDAGAAVRKRFLAKVERYYQATLKALS